MARGSTASFLGAIACLCGCNGAGASASDIQWLGLDTRALAVGSAIPVDLQFTTDGGTIVYTATSSDASIVAVTDDGGEQLVLSVLAPGNATLSVSSNFGSATRPVIAEMPAAVTFAVASRLKAGIDSELPDEGFAIVSAGSERVQALVLDSLGNSLSSWGLVQARPNAAELPWTKIEPEQFDLIALGSAGVQTTFVAGLPDGGSTSYPVSIVPSATSALMLSNDAGTTLVAEGLTQQANELQVFGLGDWQFTCQPANQCTTDQLSLSAAQLTLPAGADAGSFTVTATVAASPNSIQTVTALLKLP